MSRDATPADVLAGAARWCVVEGDSAEVLRGLPYACVDAVVTDPPAGINFMSLEFDRDRGGRAQWVAWLAEVLGYARAATRDGGRALVWSLPRTSHWTGCAVEDAGWAIENTVTHLFGTGWPKGKSQLKPLAETWWLARTGRSTELNTEAARVGTTQTVTRRNGNSGGTTYGRDERVGEWVNPPGRYPSNAVFSHSPGCVCVGERRVECNNRPRNNSYSNAIYSPGKPRVVEQKFGDPDGTELVEAWECVEGCPVRELDSQSGELSARGNVSAGVAKPRGWSPTGCGAGIVRDNAPHQTYDAGGGASRFFPCFPADPLATTDTDVSIDSDGIGIRYREWENEDQSRAAPTDTTSPPRDTCGVASMDGCDSRTSSSGNDTTGPSREGSRSTTGTATSKTTASRTSNSSTPQPTSDFTADANFATESGGSRVPSAASSRRSSSASGTSTRRDGRSTGVAASATSRASAPTITSVDFSAAPPSIFRYVAKPSRAERNAGVEGDGNIHSTVKSISLMRWLVRLVTRPGDVVLDPFGGSGTTGAAALAEGRRVILVEREPRYAEIARQRCAHATPDLGVPIRVPARAVAAPTGDARQLGLFDAGGAR